MLKKIPGFRTPWKKIVGLIAVTAFILMGCTSPNETGIADTSESAPDKSTETEEKQEQPEHQAGKNRENQKDNRSKDTPTSDQESKQQKPGDAAATVTRVVDGDTIEISLNGKTEDVRLLLVDTPETVHPDKPVQPFGPEASQFAKNKLTGKQVRVEYDGPKRDKYDRILAYIWVDGNNFNKMLLEQGLARYAYVYDPPYTHSNALMKAQNRAKSAGKGIWSQNNYVTSDGFNAQDQQSDTETGSNQESASNGSGSSNLKYNPNGPDRDCSDFDVHENAQEFYEAAGGPEEDPHRLDRDGEGTACDSLA